MEIIPIEALAPGPDGDADVVPIQSLLYIPVPAAVPGLLPFEQTFSTYFRLVQEAAGVGAGPVRSR